MLAMKTGARSDMLSLLNDPAFMLIQKALANGYYSFCAIWFLRCAFMTNFIKAWRDTPRRAASLSIADTIHAEKLNLTRRALNPGRPALDHIAKYMSLIYIYDL